MLNQDIRDIQVTEIPDIKPHITQFNIHTCSCGKCGKNVKADIPREARYSFGPNLMGFISLLSGENGTSKRKVVNLLEYLNIKVSLDSVCNIQALAGKILETPYYEIRNHTLSQYNVNGDETTWKTMGKRKWLWIATCNDSVFFHINYSRGTKAFFEVYGDNFNGILTSDRCPTFGTQSEKGEVYVERILSVIGTMKKQGKNATNI